MSDLAVGVVVIGRNEGDRLIRCLKPLTETQLAVVYVDSGSTDNSGSRARETGAEVVDLDLSIPFTAARARNTGLARLREIMPGVQLVQFVDGDCVLDAGWLETARAFLQDTPDVAVVAGRLRERDPEATIYNRLADWEWDQSAGQTAATGGIAMMRITAFDAAGGFDPSLPAGEEPELCLRMRRLGWKIWRLDADMAEHDIDMTRFAQWWRRMRRGGLAFANGAAMHGHGPEKYRVAETRRALIWGAGVPAVALLGALFSPWWLLVLAAWPAQMVRLWGRGAHPLRAVFLVLGKVPEAQGVIGFHVARLIGRNTGLIEYK